MKKIVLLKYGYKLVITFLILIPIFISCSDKKPMNIVFIMSDDHGYQAISSYDSTLIKTPNIDRLAEEGMLFKQSFVTNSICGPSRAVMLTGKYNHINGMIDNGTTFDGSQLTVNKILKDNGYTTAMVGKWHLKSEPIGFDYWNVLPGQGHYYNPDFIEMGEKKRVEGYVTDLITDYALKWLDNRDKKKPFSLFLHHKAPHRNWMPGPDYLNNYDEKEYPIPDNFFDDYANRGTAAKEQTLEIAADMFIDYDLKIPVSEKEKNQFKNEKIGGKSWEGIYNRMNDSQKAIWDKAYGDENESFKKSKLKGEDLAKWKYQRYMNDYLRCIASVDDNVGRVIEYLEENGLMENTLIIYTSDQGFYLGEHGWFDKRFMYEESHKTPLIIRTPNGKKNIVNNNDMVVNIDYAPTFLDYAGIEVPDDMQGKSLRQIIENNKAPDDWRKSVYYHYFEYPAEHGVKRHYGIRNSRYKLIHFYYDIDEWELYDLENDPNEMLNIYENPKYKSLIEELKKELELLREQYLDTDLKKYLPKENIKIDHLGVGSKVSLVNKYSPKYSGSSKNALVDGIKGPDEMFSIIDYSVWQGFEEKDMVATIDFGKTVEFSNISAGFLQCLESWIFLPDWVEYQYSSDNRNFKDIGKVERKSNLKSTKLFREEYSINSQIIKARYIKIHAKNVKTCPEWHQGAGGPAWIFSDEVTIN